MKTFYTFLVFLLLGNFTEQQTVPSSLWFGYYQEDAVNNPEDPMPGMVYLNIPKNGTFEGQLFFSYAGCDGNFDVGRISGTISNKNLNGTWEGNVDGKSVGGSYIGRLNDAKTKYDGTYTNGQGKQRIDCGTYGGYYVAAKGRWSLTGSHAKSDLDITMEIEVEEEHAEFQWNEIDDVDAYRFVIIDYECLMEKMNLEECMVWGGESVWPDLIYGDGDLPAKPLLKGTKYVINILAVGDNNEVLGWGSKEFVYR